MRPKTARPKRPGRFRREPRDGEGHDRETEQDPALSLHVAPALCLMPWFSGAGQTSGPFGRMGSVGVHCNRMFGLACP